MRYKSTFHPTYVLGQSHRRSRCFPEAEPCPDPETYEWDPLDQDMLARLSARAYVSLSRERRLGMTASLSATDGHVAAADAPATSAARHPSSIFHADMPGVMSIEDVKENISLGAIDVRLKDKTVNLAVCT